MHRLFVAIELPDTLKEEVFAIRNDLPGGRWVSPDQLHLTLRFIGEVDEQTLLAVKKGLSTVRGAPFQLAVAGIGHFPPAKSPRILWAGVHADSTLLLVQRGVESALQHAGIPGETRPFAPHITIARLKGTPLSLVREFEQLHGSFAPSPFQVAAFHLFESIFSGNSVSHVKLAEYPLSRMGG